MKKIFLLVMLALTICCTAFASEQDIVNSFKTFANTKIQPIEQTYETSHYIIKFMEGNKYVKPSYTKQDQVFTYELDVKKTDSLIFPYIGIIRLTKTTRYNGKHLSEEEAINTPMSNLPYDVVRAAVIYDYDNGNWRANYYEYADGDVRFKDKGDNIYFSFECSKKFRE